MNGSNLVYTKAPYFYHGFGLDSTLVATIDPDKAHVHRSIVQPMFSKSSLDRIALNAQKKLEQVINVMKRHNEDGKAVMVFTLLRCMNV